MNNSSELSITMTVDQRSLIVGTLLGDACCVLQKHSNNPYLSIGHSLKDIEYTRWKYNLLLPTNLIQSPINKYGAFCTMQHSGLWEFYSLFYPNGKKVLPFEALDMLGSLGLAIWYMDDGSITRTISRSPGPYCTLATQAYTWEECEIAKQWFHYEHGIRFSVYDQKKKGRDRQYPFLCTTKIADGKKFFKLVDKHIPECMSRKKYEI